MDINGLVSAVNVLVLEAITSAKKVCARDAGLDQRAAQELWVGGDFVAVTTLEDRTLRYYGGFEYVPKAARVELGDYVFYSTDDARVMEHWEQATDTPSAVYEEEDSKLCSDCSGSGEGQYESTFCRTCHGRGTVL